MHVSEVNMICMSLFIFKKLEKWHKFKYNQPGMALLRFTQSMSCWILPVLGTGQPLVAQISTLLAGQPVWCTTDLVWQDCKCNISFRF